MSGARFRDVLHAQLPVLERYDLLGARGLAIVGGLVTLLGVTFLFVLAANRGWIGPVARVATGVYGLSTEGEAAVAAWLAEAGHPG